MGNNFMKVILTQLLLVYLIHNNNTYFDKTILKTTRGLCY